MSLKKTLILSVLFHLCFFAASLLSADLSKGSSKTHEGKVFFVRLSEEGRIAEKSPYQDALPVVKKSLYQPVPHPVEEPAYYQPSPLVGEGKGEGLNVHEEPSGHIALANYENGENAGNEGTVAGKSRETSSKEIIEIIRNSIERVKTYPLLAHKRGIEGTVHVSFRINPEGEPVEIKVLKSSGSWILDMATLNVIKKAASFPYTEERIEVPVIYKLMN